MDNKELFEERNRLTSVLHKELDSWEAETRNSTNSFDVKANSIWKEKISKIEADLDAVETQINIASKRAKMEVSNTPLFDTRGAIKGSDPEADYSKRFAEALFSGNRVALERVMSERTNVTTGGGNFSPAIPTEFQNRIVEKINQFNIMRQICPVRTVGMNQKIVVGGALPTAYKVSEAGAITEDATFSVANVDVGHLTYACYVPVSKQYTNDAIGGIQYIATKAGEAIGNLVEAEYTSGAGTSGNMPGLLTTSGIGSIDTGGTLANWIANASNSSSDDLIDLAHTVAPQYRNGAVFMMSDTIAKTVRKFKDGVNNYVWKNPDRYSDIRDGMPSTIYGFPVYINQTMETAPADTEPFVCFFNPNYYEIYDREGVDVMIDPYGLSTSLMNRLVVSLRTYGVCTNPNAVAVLTL